MAFIVIVLSVFVGIPIASLFFASDSRFTDELSSATTRPASDWFGVRSDAQR